MCASSRRFPVSERRPPTASSSNCATNCSSPSRRARKRLPRRGPRSTTTFTPRSSTSATNRATPNRPWRWRAKSSATTPSSPPCSRPPCASSRGRDHRRPPAKDVVEAPDAGAVRGDEEEQEAVEHRQLALVLDGPQAVVRVRREIGDGHLAAGDERRNPGEEPDGDQKAADQLDTSADLQQRRQRTAHPLRHRRIAEELLRTVHREHQAGNDPKDGKRLRRKAPDNLSHYDTSAAVSSRAAPTGRGDCSTRERCAFPTRRLASS